MGCAHEGLSLESSFKFAICKNEILRGLENKVFSLSDMVSPAKGSKLTGFKGTLENSSKQFVTVGYTIAYKTSLEKPKPQNTNKKSVKTLYSVQNSFLDLTNLFEVD